MNKSMLTKDQAKKILRALVRHPDVANCRELTTALGWEPLVEDLRELERQGLLELLDDEGSDDLLICPTGEAQGLYDVGELDD